MKACRPCQRETARLLDRVGEAAVLQLEAADGFGSPGGDAIGAYIFATDATEAAARELAAPRPCTHAGSPVADFAAAAVARARRLAAADGAAR